MRLHQLIRITCFAGLIAALLASATPRPIAPEEQLSAYGFFSGDIARQQPAAGVVPYQLNTPLFSDYAEKLRFLRLPPGTTATYNSDSVFSFPVGTTLIKTFYYPLDFRDPSKGRRLMETRLLIHEANGWKAWTYIWNAEQTDAYLEVAGDKHPVQFTDLKGKTVRFDYIIPNQNQCKGCHNTYEVLTPIGPSARQLNGDLSYPTGKENQLQHWMKAGLLSGLEDVTQAPKAPVWNDPHSGTLEARARTWLDINCAHCHKPGGPASTSGLFLQLSEKDPTRMGIMKTPVAAGRGASNLQYDIVPGHPDQSILVYRMLSTDPGIMMPELSRKLTHQEGITLVQEWIKKMK